MPIIVRMNTTSTSLFCGINKTDVIMADQKNFDIVGAEIGPARVTRCVYVR